MIEIPDTFRDGEDAEVKTPISTSHRGIPLPVQLGGLQESHKLPQRWIWCVLRNCATEHISDDKDSL